MYIEKWNNAENLIAQESLNSNFDDEKEIHALNSFIIESGLNKSPVKIKEFSESHNTLILELPFVVLICESCYTLSLNFYSKQKSALRIRKSRFENNNAFEVSFDENIVHCELLKVRKFGYTESS